MTKNAATLNAIRLFREILTGKRGFVIIRDLELPRDDAERIAADMGLKSQRCGRWGYTITK